MSAYVIVDIEVQDPVGYERYREIAPETIAVFGGRYLTRGGRTEVLEGEWQPKRLVILEFESVERAKAWLNSSAYGRARELRQRTARSNMILVEGVPPAGA